MSADDIRAHLTSQRKEALVEILMDQVGRDELLRERIMLEVGRRSSKVADIAPLVAAIEHAVSFGEYLDWEDAPTVAHSLDSVIARMETLLSEGHAPEVVELAAHGLATAKGAFEYVDDSNGSLGDTLERMGALHLKACRKANPDPVELAGWLFGQHLHEDYGTFVEPIDSYSRVLGRDGRAAYRQLAEAEWAKVPPRRAGDEQARTYGEGSITRIMEGLARVSGSTDELVEVMSRDLSGSYAYLRIAEVMAEARRDDEALEWAERGAREFPALTESRLREFLAGAYHHRGRHEEAMALAWSEYDEHPVLQRYRGLMGHAERAGDRPIWRDKALARLRTEVKRAKARARDQWGPAADGSELVGVFLWEGDEDAAWQEAITGGCSELLWRELATRRETKYPEDALAIYQRHVELALAQKNNSAYQEAFALVLRIRTILRKLGRREDFSSYLNALRTAHRPKRNFMKLLDATRW